MRLLQITAAVLFACTLCGCSESVVDNANIRITDGVIHEVDDDSPFTGKVINAPMLGLPEDLGSLKKLALNSSMDSSLQHLWTNASFGALLNGSHYAAPATCEANVVDGKLHGSFNCTTTEGGQPIAEIPYVNGLIEGHVVIFSLKRASGSIYAEGNYTAGKLNGQATIYASDGSVAYQGNFTSDQPDGKAIKYHPFGWLEYEMEFKDGKKHGTWKQYSDKSHTSMTVETWENGIRQSEKSVTADMAEPDRSATETAPSETCADSWMNAFHQEFGADAPISGAQLEEWEQWCAEGKTPSS